VVDGHGELNSPKDARNAKNVRWGSGVGARGVLTVGELERHALRRSWEGDHIPDVPHAGRELYEPHKSQVEAMRLRRA
jgi:hypothetical protein